MDSAARREFEESTRGLVGLRLTGVRYVDLGDDDPRPRFDLRSEFDSMDYGLELVGDGGRVVGLEWTDRFDVWCGVWIVEGGIGKVGRAVWDVSERSRWSSMVGRCLTHVEVHWVDLESHERTKYVLPYSLELQFESDRVWIAAVEVAHTRDDYFLLRMTSHITVAFDEGAASEYGLLPLPN